MTYRGNAISEPTDVAMLKKEFLRLLKEDEEFRYAVAGLIGLGEILRRLDRHEEELKKLREDFLTFVKEQEKRWEENNRRWEENNSRWEENEKRWEENSRRWEEAYKRFEAIENELKKLREDFNRFVELEERRWEENNRRWDENNKRWEDANRRFSRIELGLGSLSESVYSRYVWEDLREEIRSRGEHVISRLRNTDIDGVEVDLLIETDRAIYVVEVKVKPSTEDVDVLLAKSEAVYKKLGKPVVPILSGALVGREVELYARSRGIKVYRY